MGVGVELVISVVLIGQIYVRKSRVMKVWVVVNQKGGVGKIILFIVLVGLLVDVGKCVVVVDLDFYGLMISYFGYDLDIFEYSVFDLFLYQGNVFEGLLVLLLCSISNECIFLLLLSIVLVILECQLLGKSGFGLVVLKSLVQFWQDFDYVIIDSLLLFGVLMVNVLVVSQYLVILVQIEFFVVKGLEWMVNILVMINWLCKQVLFYIIVFMLFDWWIQVLLSMLWIFNENYLDNLWQVFIFIDICLCDVSWVGVMLLQYDGKSCGVIVYCVLFKYLLVQQLVIWVV